MTHNGRETVPDDWWLTVAKRTLVESGLGDSSRPKPAAGRLVLSDPSGRFATVGRNGTNQSRHPDSGRRASMPRGLLHAGDAEQTTVS